MKKTDTTASPVVTRGKYANLLKQGTNLVILDPALLPFFPDSESVNRALHAFLAINDQVQAVAKPTHPRRRLSQPAAPAFDPRVGTHAESTAR